MFNNYTLTQTDKNDGNGNKCGGYALAALIHAKNNRNARNQPDGDAIYQQVIGYQKNISSAFLQGRFSPGNPVGAQSLPSSLINTAVVHDFTDVKVTITSDCPLKELVPFDQERIQSEVKIRPDRTKTLAELTNKQGFYLVLVNGGSHWIAAARNATGLYFYNPGDASHPQINDVNFAGVTIRMQ